jgi:hypothetical protein
MLILNVDEEDEVFSDPVDDLLREIKLANFKKRNGFKPIVNYPSSQNQIHIPLPRWKEPI